VLIVLGAILLRLAAGFAYVAAQALQHAALAKRFAGRQQAREREKRHH
jgi:hypothetical protein